MVQFSHERQNKAIGLRMPTPGDFRDLQLDQWTCAPPKEGELRVQITSCALNFADLLLCKGTYQIKPEGAFSPGLEITGKIDMPDHPRHLQRVVGLVDYGGLCSLANFPEEQLVAIPHDVSDFQASCLPVGYGTSEAGLYQRARLRAGERVLIHGGTSGVGRTAAELAQAAGHEVILSASSPQRKELLESRGYQHVFLLDETFRSEVEGRFGRRPIDVVYDAIGGEAARTNLSLLAFQGRYLVIGFAGGPPPQFPANLLLVKNIDVIGFYWGGYVHNHPELYQQTITTLLEKVRGGLIRPFYEVLDGFESALEGLKMLENRSALGKIIINLNK
ncbi:MAG: NADPH:quinone oxidoreductase family protein [Alphaproteobacteria bacterium]